jgi:hypothetical protein
MKNIIEGHCNCGSVAFEIDGSPAGIYVCHCSICRRSTGTNGIAVVLVPGENFRWTQGEDHVSTWSKPGTNWETWFCKKCGSRLPGKNDNERVFIPAGLLPGSGLGFKVQAHIWVHSRAEWDEIGDEGQQYPERYGEGAA